MDNPKKANYFRTKTDEELQRSIGLFLTMSNLGGSLCDDYIEELFRRIEAKESEPAIN